MYKQEIIESRKAVTLEKNHESLKIERTRIWKEKEHEQKKDKDGKREILEIKKSFMFIIL